jgi:hypothetical protein
VLCVAEGERIDGWWPATGMTRSRANGLHDAALPHRVAMRKQE